MACEKCWSDAGLIAASAHTSKAYEYSRLMEKRADNPCTPEEQCGVGTTELHILFDWKDGTRHCVCGKREGLLKLVNDLSPNDTDHERENP